MLLLKGETQEIRLKHLRIKVSMLHAMRSGDDMAAVDEGPTTTSARQVPVLQILNEYRPGVLVERVSTRCDAAFMG